VLLLAATLMPVWAAADRPPGTVGEFMGWNPASTEFAYRLHHHSKGASAWMKRTSPSGVAQKLRVKGGIAVRMRRQGAATRELKGQRLSTFVQAFIVGPGITLRVVLELGKRKLHYTMWLDDASRPGQPKRLLIGYFKEIWTDFSARVFPSPDGKWVAVQLTMSTPYRIQTWFEGVQVRLRK